MLSIIQEGVFPGAINADYGEGSAVPFHNSREIPVNGPPGNLISYLVLHSLEG